MNIELDTLGPFALVIIAGLFVHACFALSVSMLTLLGSHAIGTGKRHGTVMGLAFGYLTGALLATTGVLAVLTYLFTTLLPARAMPIAWIIVCALCVIIGWVVLLSYYRRGKGTRLWLPRRFINYASTHAKKAKRPVETFGLGVSMVVAELPSLLAPMALCACVLATLASTERSIGILGYGVAACMPLFVIVALIGGGHKVSTIQRWRESNKKFLQWTSGLTLMMLGIYVFAMTIWGNIR